MDRSVQAADRPTASVSTLLRDAMQITVGAGQLSVRNDAGALTLNAGQRGFVADRSTLPYVVGNVIPDRIAP